MARLKVHPMQWETKYGYILQQYREDGQRNFFVPGKAHRRIVVHYDRLKPYTGTKQSLEKEPTEASSEPEVAEEVGRDRLQCHLHTRKCPKR